MSGKNAKPKSNTRGDRIQPVDNFVGGGPVAFDNPLSVGGAPIGRVIDELIKLNKTAREIAQHLREITGNDLEE